MLNKNSSYFAIW